MLTLGRRNILVCELGMWFGCLDVRHSEFALLVGSGAQIVTSADGNLCGHAGQS